MKFDFNEILNLNIFSYYLGDGYSVTLYYALLYNNYDLAKAIVSFLKNENPKQFINLDFRNEGYVRRNKEDKSPYCNYLYMNIKKGYRSGIREIINIMINDIANFPDVCDTMRLCLDELHKKFEDLYVELIKNISSNKEEIDIDISRIDNPYVAITTKFEKTPYWPKHLALLEKNKLINAILKSPEYQQIEKRNYRPVRDSNEKIYYAITNHPILYDFDKKMNKLKEACVLSGEEKEELEDNVHHIISKYMGDEKSESSVIPWKGAAKIGEEGLLHNIVSKGMEKETFASENIQSIIDYKLNLFGWKYLFIDLAIHVLLLLFFTLYCILMRLLENKSTLTVVWSQLLLFFSWIIAVYNFYNEIIQFRWIIYYCNKCRKKMKLSERLYKVITKWMNSKWNFFEFIMYFIIFIMPIFHLMNYFHVIVSDLLLQSIASLAAVFIWWKLLYFMLPFKSIGPQVNMIFEILKDIYVFLIVILIILGGFSTMFYGMFDDETNVDENGYFDSFGLSLVTTYGMMLGDFDSQAFTSLKSSFLPTLLFMFYMFIMMIVMLNLLIAIIGDSFDKIRPHQKLSFYESRCLIISDIENKMLKSKQTKIKYHLF